MIADEDYVDHPAWVNKWADRIEPISTAIRVVLDFIHPPIKYVKIDRYDTWSMDHTLSQIILPMLKQLNKEKHGAPYVDDDDVPDELKSTNAEPKENEWDTDSNHFKRWDYVMNEMIWAFEHLVDDTWEEEFWSGDRNDPNEDIANMVKPGWKTKRVWDREGHEKMDDRIKKGLILFGKYYRNLWD